MLECRAVRALVSLLALTGLLGLGAASAASAAKDKGPRITVRTSLGPLETTGSADGERDLRARGTAPAGSRLTISFYRGSRRLGTRRVTLGDSKRVYATSLPIDRTGSYKVRVSARPPSSPLLIRATAKLEYGPGARAPSAPGNSLRP